MPKSIMKKKIFLAILILVLVGAVFVVKGAVKTAKNLCIVKGLFNKIAASQSGIQSYPPPPQTLELTEEEVNAGLDLCIGIILLCAFFANVKFLKNGN